MRVRNHDEAPIQMMVRVNPGEMVSYTDAQGNETTKKAAPKLTHIYIPALAEVELEDALWVAAMKTSTLVREFETQYEEYPGFSDQKLPYKRPVFVPTGKTRMVNLLKERIKEGRLTVTEKPASAKSVKDMVEDLAKHKVVVTSDSHTEEDVRRLHAMLCE